MRAVKECLRLNGRTRAGNILQITAFFAGYANAVACLVNEKIAFAVRTAAMNMIFFGKVAENEKDHIADMLVAVKIIAFICFVYVGKLRVVNDTAQFLIRKLNGFHDCAFGADEKNVNTCVRARKREELSV